MHTFLIYTQLFMPCTPTVRSYAWYTSVADMCAKCIHHVAIMVNAFCTYLNELVVTFR